MMGKIILPHLYKVSFIHVPNFGRLCYTTSSHSSVQPKTHHMKAGTSKEGNNPSLRQVISSWKSWRRTPLSPFLCFSYIIFGFQCDFLQDLDTSLESFDPQQSHWKDFLWLIIHLSIYSEDLMHLEHYISKHWLPSGISVRGLKDDHT